MQEEVQGIWNFLNENTDLKEKLAPQMEQLQRRVDQHEQQINVLNERVDQLEVKVTQGARGPDSDPRNSKEHSCTCTCHKRHT